MRPRPCGPDRGDDHLADLDDLVDLVPGLVPRLEPALDPADERRRAHGAVPVSSTRLVLRIRFVVLGDVAGNVATLSESAERRVTSSGRSRRRPAGPPADHLAPRVGASRAARHRADRGPRCEGEGMADMAWSTDESRLRLAAHVGGGLDQPSGDGGNRTHVRGRVSNGIYRLSRRLISLRGGRAGGRNHGAQPPKGVPGRRRSTFRASPLLTPEPHPTGRGWADAHHLATN